VGRTDPAVVGLCRRPVWAAVGAVVLWWAPLQHVPSGANRELHEHGWTVLAANSFFDLLAAFLVGVAVLLTLRRHRTNEGRVRVQASPAASTAAPT
jgi:hypothetical protein